MHPVLLELHNFRGWRDGGPIKLDRPLVLIIGDNGRGKSTLLNAIEWCLFGQAVEKKGCGVAERAEWRIDNRNYQGEAVEVALTFQDGDERVTLRRRREPDARKSADALLVQHPSGQTLSGGEATDWMLTKGLPNWATWRRAFCQHQEIVRSRVTEKADRSSILGSLLGLEEYDKLRFLLKNQRTSQIIKQLDASLDSFERDLERRNQQPAEDLYESEQRLGALGLESTQLGPALSVSIGQRIVQRAGQLASSLGIKEELPACENEADELLVRRWAQEWTTTVRSTAKVTERFHELTKRRGAIAGELEQLRPLEERWKVARNRLSKEEADNGDETTQGRLLTEAEQMLNLAAEALQKKDENRALLQHAQQLLSRSHEQSICPVCGSSSPELMDRLERALGSDVQSELTELKDQKEQKRKRLQNLEKSLRTMTHLVREEADTRRSLERARERLTALLPPQRTTAGQDVLAAAKDELAGLHENIRKLETAIGDMDSLLEEHRLDLERLRELAKWRSAAKRAEQRTDLGAAPSWAGFQEAIDTAAGFATDLEALDSMLRTAQAEHSLNRTAQVNRYLGSCLGEITTKENDLDVRVHVHRTPKGLTYELEDGLGDRALTTQNQASLNAISFALLFAQATVRARANQPAWVLLDDPSQSFDDEHQKGLARAITRVAQFCPMIVATTPGLLAEMICELVSFPHRVLHLGPWDGAKGVNIAREEER